VPGSQERQYTGQIIQILKLLLEKERRAKDTFKMVHAIAFSIAVSDVTQFDSRILTQNYNEIVRYVNDFVYNLKAARISKAPTSSFEIV
jgi:hypothetical protein